MMNLLYIVSLVLSSGTVGVFIHKVLAAEGFTLSFNAGLWLICTVASLYAVLQIAFMCIVVILKPVRDGKLPAAEALSQLTVLILWPFIFDISVELPAMLQKIEPLLFLGVFAVAHCLLKFLSFFAALQSRPGNRIWSLVWLGFAAVLLFTARFSGYTWLEYLEQARPRVSDGTQSYSIGGVHATARRIPEGAVYEYALSSPIPERCLTVRWSHVPDQTPVLFTWNDDLNEEDDQNLLERIHVTVTLEGDTKQTWRRTVRINDSKWTGIRVPASQFPSNTHTCHIMWTSEQEPRWRRISGLRPIIRSQHEMLMSGPFEHSEVRGPEEPNIIVLAIDGLGYNHMSRSGYKRATTNALDRFGHISMSFDNAYTAAPEAKAAFMTLLSGQHPLRHGYLGGNKQSESTVQLLSEVLRAQGYATAAFTEGDTGNDLVYGSGFENGFELFDSTFTWDADLSNAEMTTQDSDEEVALPPPAGTQVTLDKAKAWIDEHNDIRFFLFIRLRELHALSLSPRYGTPFKEGRGEPTLRDIFDTALTYVDLQTGAFIKYIHDYETRANTMIILTSPYGFDFSTNADALPRIGLSDTSLRIPLLIQASWLQRTTREDPVSIEDIAPSLAALAQTRFTSSIDGMDIFAGPTGRNPVSVFGNPLTVTMANSQWRLFWETGIPWGSSDSTAEEKVPTLYEIRRSRRSGWNRDEASRQRTLVEQWTRTLRDQLALYGVRRPISLQDE